MPKVNVPGGGSINFPDDTPPEVMEQVLSQITGTVSATTEKMPPIVPGGNAEAAGLWATLKASLAPKVEDQIEHYSRTMKIPRERFGVLQGEIVYADQKGQYQRVVPPVFEGPTAEVPERAARYVASQFGPSAPGVAGGIAGTLTAPSGLASIPAAGAASFVTDAARQALSNYMLDRSPLSPIDWLNSAGQAGLSMAGQGIGLAAAKGLQNNPLGVSAADRVKAADPARIAEGKRIAAEAQQRGVTLSAGQSTNLNSLKQTERQALRWPETADTVADFRASQRDTQIPAAVRSEISRISNVPSTEAASQLREGAKAVVKHVTDIRAGKAAPLYDEAFKANASVASPEIDKILETPAGKQALKNAAYTMQNFRSKMGLPDKEIAEHVKELVERGEMAQPKGGVAAGLKLRSLDLVKRHLDEMANTASRAGDKLNASAYGDLARQLRGELDRLDVTGIAGPNSTKAAGGAYARARAIFQADSPAIDTLQKGAVGKLARMEGDDAISMVRSVFDKGRNPADVRKMKMAFQAAGKDPEWNAGIAGFLSDKLDEAMVVNAQGERGNVAGKVFKSVWGDERQKRVVEAALPQGRLQSIEKLMEVLNAASRSLPEGSPTATDLGAMAPGRLGSTGRILGTVASPGKWLNLGDEVTQGVAAIREPAKRRQLVDALLSGRFDQELSRMRMVSPGSKQAAALTAQILTGAGVLAGREMFEPQDRAPIDASPLQ